MTMHSINRLTYTLRFVTLRTNNIP